MDDPWGSPWTSTAQDQGRHDGSATEIRPAPADAPSHPNFSFSSLQEQSPWAKDNSDDDGFGDWATVDPLNASARTTTAVGTGTGTDGASPVKAVPLLPSFNTHQPSPAWSTSPVGNSTAELSKRHSLVNSSLSGLSVDPWNTAVAQNTEWGLPTLNLDDSNKGHAAKTNLRFIGGSKEKYNSEAASGAADAASRPSSRGSDRSRDAVPLQDSPTTSVEDVLVRPPLLQRKPSSKVQGLVELFDGLSKPEEPTNPESVSLVADTPETAYVSRPEAPGLEAVKSEPPLLSSLPPPTHMSPSLDRTVVFVQPPHEKNELASAGERGSSFKHHATASNRGSEVSSSFPTVAGLLKQYGHQPYTCDQEKINSFYQGPNAHAGKFASAGASKGAHKDTDTFIPDHILDDSFTSISERKVWYRISRQGSYRKHNAGDDENYRPVTWATSAVRAKTVQIVRRWMEEDSITGRPTLGGGGVVRGNLFGWDSTTEPVALDQVFKKKSSSNSNGKLPRAHKMTLSTATPSWADAGDQGLSAVPIFDQGKGEDAPNSTPGTHGRRNTPRPRSNSIVNFQAHSNPGSPLETELESFSRGPLQPVQTIDPATSTAAANAGEAEDDDEWGEMVSSPTVGGAGAAPSERIPQTRKTPPEAPVLLRADAQPSDAPVSVLVDRIIGSLPDLAYMAG